MLIVRQIVCERRRMRSSLFYHTTCSLWRRRGLTAKPYRCFLSSASFSTADYDNGDAFQSNSSKVKIFDRHLKRKQRDRAAWLLRPNDSFVDAVAENLLDRLEDCKKTFPTALCLGGSLQAVRRLLRGRGEIDKLIMMDTSYDMVKRCESSRPDSYNENIETSYVVGDEEFLPIKESSVELVISCLGLHWTNDLPGSMIQCKLALKPDGLFLAAILGGETLKELRIACTVAQMEREGGISPRISPLAQVRDAGNLLTRAGFALPGVDVDEYVVRYKSALDLIEHLREMGETNALLERSNILKRETAVATAAIYDALFAAEDGTIPATFQVIYMTGWREHPSQQKAKRRGSATVSFKDIQKQFGSGG
ncbi:S-adenosyl-L-methionine-dependent methyltransferases superfamily protein [Theobroma cacao]|uniref:S-adenosyl-L-methionine-dependent methyltransferases superfamily protein n=1 Tax=Theobroma cacao TaxID=3641 RepID=A0A061FR95_THECC|nr:S-adenosyl-L-methionine-dependent methyltransferases superfamily protein [Theobroma cacao]